jgi:5-formyltetrahydrofolate cyclo-ligase
VRSAVGLAYRQQILPDIPVTDTDVIITRVLTAD